MLNCSFVIENPWSKYKWRSMWTWHKKIAKHKSIDVQFMGYSKDILGFRLELDWRGRDHAGPRIEIIIATYTLCVHMYDDRHWNWETDEWEIYTEEDTCQNQKAETVSQETGTV